MLYVMLLWLCFGGLVFHLVPILTDRVRLGVLALCEAKLLVRVAVGMLLAPYALVYVTSLWSLKFLRGGK